MGESLSGAAARVVDTLSRRRFLRWLGAGGVALAAGLGLDRSSAHAQGERCKAVVQRFPLAKPGTFFGQNGCVRRGVFSTTCHLPGTFAAACANLMAGQCAQADDCMAPQTCQPIFISAENVVEECKPTAAANCVPPCGANENCCHCHVRVRGGFDNGTLVCGCACK